MIKKNLIRLKNNELINTIFFSGVGTVIGLLSTFIVQKVIAITVGPSGIAIISQFQNFIGISTAISTGGIKQGVIKYTAEYKTQNNERTKIISTAFQLTLFFTILVGALIFLFSKSLSAFLFQSQNYKYAVDAFGLTVVLFGLNQLIIGILNGLGEIKRLVAVNIASNLFGLIVTGGLSYKYKLSGALIALSISQAVIFFISLYFLLKSKTFNRSFLYQKLDFKSTRKLFNFSLMAIASLVITPIVQIAIRNYTIDALSIEYAGIWDGLLKISGSYLSMVTITLSIYYLPKISFLKEREQIRSELIRGYKLIIPILLISSIIIYFLREYIIVLLYTKEFLLMEELFLPQIIGDFIRIVAWLLSYIMIAKAMVKLFIFTEVIFSASIYLLSVFFIDSYGLVGLPYAHLINYSIYLLTMIFFLKGYLLKNGYNATRA